MEQEPGDTYLRRLSSFIRANEKNLAEAGFHRRRRTQRPFADSASLYNPLSWFSLDSSSQSTTPKPVVLSLDTHRLFYVLMRMEALGLDVGTLDVQVDNPSRPMSYINIFTDSDKSDTLSLASFRSSLSSISNLSLSGRWWGRTEPPSVDSELIYLYSSFTKIPALSVNAPGRKVIAELFNEAPNQNALPLDAFKNLQKLECVDIDPRTLLGWDKLAESLVSLKIKKSGLEDLTDIFVGAVIDDQARREGSTSRKRQRRIPHGSASDPSFFSTRLPESVPEDVDAEESAAIESNESQAHRDNGSSSPAPPAEISSSKWAFLKSLSLSDNSLTFIPSGALPYLTSLSYLDLSANLLVSVPPGLGALYNLVSLNLADNMIDSVLGIYLNLGQVLTLNIAHNRLESICGLERLTALERVDLRGNLIEESAEIGRLAVLPNISEVWVEGNPLVEVEESYRTACFDYFWKEQKTIKLDGTPPGFYERRNLTVLPPEQMTSSRPISTVPSPPVVAVGHKHAHHQTPPQQSSVPDIKYPTPPSSNTSPSLDPAGAVIVSGKPRRKKTKRIVELDTEHSANSSLAASASHFGDPSTASTRLKPKTKIKSKKPTESSPLPEDTPPVRKGGQIGTLDVDGVASPAPRLSFFVEEQTSFEQVSTLSTNMPRQPDRSPENTTCFTHHRRHHSEFIPSLTSLGNLDLLTSSSKSPSLEKHTTLGPTTPASVRKETAPINLSSMSAARRARDSASVFAQPAPFDGGEGIGGGEEDIKGSADTFRQRIEALKKEMGDSWLKVYSQSQIQAPNS